MEGKSLTERVLQWPSAAKNYVDELRQEMRRVTWPNWKQVRATTLVVIVSVFLFAGYFYVVDLLVSRLITRIFNLFTK